MQRRSIANRVACLVIMTSLISICSLDAWGGRTVPDDYLALPVLVELDTKATATGFYLGDGKYIYLVTAKHVLFDTSKTLKSNGATLTSYPGDPTDSGRNVLKIDLKAMNEANDIRYDKTHDVAVIRIGQLSRKGKRKVVGLFDGVKLKEKTESNFLYADTVFTKKFYEVLIGNEIYIFGYPTSLGLKKIPQLDYNRPLLRRGIVAGKNRSLETIILDCPGYKGNSGGPVVEVEKVNLGKTVFNVIGVVVQFVPYVTHGYGYSDTTTIILNSGYSVAIPIEIVLELLRKE